MKKFGQLIICFIPMLVMLGINIVVSMIMMVVKAVQHIMASGNVVPDDYFDYVMALGTDKDFLLSATIVFQLVLLIVAAIVYYFGFKEKNFEKPGKVWGGLGWLWLVILFIGTELALSCALIKAYDVIPTIMDNYAALMEQSGLGELSVLSTIATLIMAPIGEELVFRGITFKLARKLTKKFWIANIIQAAMFGIAHMNLVQGVYAFLLGMVLGYVYRKYNSIYASMLAHLTFNFGGTYIVALIFGADDSNVPGLKVLLAFLAAVILIATGLVLMNRDALVAERDKMFFARWEKERLPKAQPVYYVLNNEEPISENKEE